MMTVMTVMMTMKRRLRTMLLGMHLLLLSLMMPVAVMLVVVIGLLFVNCLKAVLHSEFPSLQGDSPKQRKINTPGGQT